MSTNHAVVIVPEAPGRLVIRPVAEPVPDRGEAIVPHISVERPWTEIAQVAQDLIARRFPGKAVLTLD